MDLSCIFRELCSKTLQVKELKQLESRIAVTLCNPESIFPPSFFTIMVHLVTYMVMEAKIARPIHYCWMYLIERWFKYKFLSTIDLFFVDKSLYWFGNRYLLRLNSYNHNKAHREGSIVEGYMAKECLTFCSYLESIETLFTRPLRNVENARGETQISSLIIHPGCKLIAMCYFNVMKSHHFVCKYDYVYYVNYSNYEHYVYP